MKKTIFLSIFLLFFVGVNAQLEKNYLFKVTCNTISIYEITPDEFLGILLTDTEACNAIFVIEDDVITFTIYEEEYVYKIYAKEQGHYRNTTKYICEDKNEEDMLIVFFWEEEMVGMSHYDYRDDVVLHINQIEYGSSNKK